MNVIGFTKQKGWKILLILKRRKVQSKQQVEMQREEDLY